MDLLNYYVNIKLFPEKNVLQDPITTSQQELLHFYENLGVVLNI